jgi:hypothetical protein
MPRVITSIYIKGDNSAEGRSPASPSGALIQSSDETSAMPRVTSRDIIVEWRSRGHSFILHFVAGTPERADLTQI